MISIAYGEDRTTHMLMFACIQTVDLEAQKDIFMKFYIDKPSWNNLKDKNIIPIFTKIKEMALGI